MSTSRERALALVAGALRDLREAEDLIGDVPDVERWHLADAVAALDAARGALAARR
jgi:Flp pilus assembly protein TadD